MSHYVYAPKRDANHAQVARWYIEEGCSVVDTHTLGFGFPDMIIAASGLMEATEVKVSTGGLSASQKEFAEGWRGPKIVIARTQDDVIAHVQRMRAKQARI